MCQNWTAIPPYNTLWPLWSPALSPIDPVSGAPTPIVTGLTSTTLLPVQPGLTWDPAQQFPWLLYNSPFGSLIFFDVVFGLNPWPPVNYITPVPTLAIGPAGVPVSINLPAGFEVLPPTDPAWILSTVPLANDYYAAAYQYYSYLAPLINPLFSAFSTGYTLPQLLPDFLDTLVATSIAPTVIVPPFLSAAALLGT
ncbi:MAG: hypothetical protein ACMUIS_06710 [bacterium]